MTYRWSILALLCFVRGTMGIQSQSIPPIAPYLMADMGLVYAQIGLLIGLFSAPGLVLAFLGGLLAARMGDRRVLVFGLVLLVLGAEAFAFSGSFYTAFAGRLLSGTGFVLANMLMMKLVTDQFEGRELSTAMGILMMSWPLGISLALGPGGAIAAAVNWRATLHVAGGLSLVALVLSALLLRDSRTRGHQGAPESGLDGTPDDGTMKEAAEGNRKIRQPASPWPAWHEVGPIVLVSLLWGLYNSGFVVFLGFAPTLLAARGLSDAAAGATVSAASWVWVVSLPVGGMMVDRWGRHNRFIVGGALCSALLLGLLPLVIEPLGAAVPLFIALVGLSFGAAPGAVMALPAQVMRPPVRNIAFGIFYTGNYLLMGAFPPLAGWLLDATGNDAAPVWFSGALFLAMPFVLALFLRLQRRTGG